MYTRKNVEKKSIYLYHAYSVMQPSIPDAKGARTDHLRLSQFPVWKHSGCGYVGGRLLVPTVQIPPAAFCKFSSLV